MQTAPSISSSSSSSSLLLLSFQTHLHLTFSHQSQSVFHKTIQLSDRNKKDFTCKLRVENQVDEKTQCPKGKHVRATTCTFLTDNEPLIVADYVPSLRRDTTGKNIVFPALIFQTSEKKTIFTTYFPFFLLGDASKF